MSLCILCQKAPPDPDKPEHILLNALGGRVTTHKALCSACNTAMGAGPDKELADSVASLRNFANLRSGSGKKPPSIQNVEADGLVYDLAPGGVPVLRLTTPFVAEKGDDGVNIIISARDEAHLEKLLLGAARKLGLPEAAYGAFIEDAKQNATKTTGFAPSARHHLSLGSEASQRSMMKACLVLWNELVGNDELAHPRYAPSREFIRSVSDTDDINDTPLICMHTQKLHGLPEGYGLNPNFIWVGSNEAGKVLGYFRLYDTVGWLFELAHLGAPAGRSISLVSNPFQPSQYHCARDEEVSVTFAEVEAIEAAHSAPDFDEARQALGQLLQQAYNASWDRTVEELFNEALEAAGLKDGDILEDQKLQDFFSAVADRFAHLITRTPRTEPLKRNGKLQKDD